MRRRRGRKNPTTATWLVIGGGVALAGVGVYFLTKKPSAVAPPPNTSTTAAAMLPPANGGSMIVYTDPSGKTYTRDAAAQTACTLRKIGHANEAAFWANLVTSNGGSLPC
jgi:hypothetical protein